MVQGRIIGIDLGTTNSCVALVHEGEPKVIANAEGARTTPSVVAFGEDGEQLVGQIAKRQAMTNPTHTVYAAKRLIGRKFAESGIEELTAVLPYTVTAADNGDAWVQVGERACSPSEIGAAVLTAMKQAAESFLGEPVTRAIVTVPAYFDDNQRQATKDAGTIAGLHIERIINEPTAATLAYGLHEKASDDDPKTVAVYDLGGGTFDISLLELRDGVFEVLATAGDTFLGGEDFDHAVVNWCAEEFIGEHDIDLRTDKLAAQRLKEAAEKAKEELSWSLETEINLPFIAARDGKPMHFARTLTRGKLEELTRDLVVRTLGPCKQVLEDAELEVSDVDDVLLVGGQTRMPLVQTRVEEFFGRTPNKSVNPDEVVAAGAAIQAAVLEGELENVLLLDVVPLHIGVETQGGLFEPVIARNTTIPTKKTQVFSTTVDNQPVVNIHVAQGLRELVDDNQSLARFQLTDIPPAPRGVPQIQVTFGIDANGMLSVSAKDIGTGRETGCTVTPTSGLTESQIESLAHEAQQRRADDVARKSAVELRNRAQTLVYTCKRSLEAYGNLLSEVDQTDIANDVERVEHALDSDDPGQIHKALEALESSSHQIYEAMMAQSTGEA